MNMAAFNNMKLSLISLLFLLFLILSGPICVRAEYQPLDLVLLLDNSGSMKSNDPHKLSIQAAKLFLRLIGENAQIGLISFDTYGQLLSPLKPYSPSRDWKVLGKNLDQIGYEGSFTNIYAGLKEALAEMEKKGRGQAKKIVILFTDGHIELPPIWSESEEKGKEKISIELLPIFKEKGISILGIAFTAQADRALLEEISYGTGGGSYMVLSAKELQKVILEILNNIRPQESLPILRNRFLVDQDVEEMSLFIPKETPKETLVLEKPGQVRISKETLLSDMKWYSNPGYEMITLRKPEIGEWTILSENKKDREGKALVITNLKLEASLQENYFNPGDTPDISLWLTKDGKRIVDPAFISSVTFQAKVAAPRAENDQTMELSDDGSHYDTLANDGVYTNRLGPMKEGGRYKITFLASGKTFNRQIERDFWVKKMIDETISNPSLAGIAYNAPSPDDQSVLPEQTHSSAIAHENEGQKTVKLFLVGNLVLLLFVTSAYVFTKRRKHNQQKQL